LIGVTAASAGERFPSPFMHLADLQGNQHGATMPGVEVLANALNTILRGRYYGPVTDWLAFCWAALAAALTLFVLQSFAGRHASLKQTAALALLLGLVFLSGYAVFVAFRLIPPLTAATVSFASAGLLGLLRRSFFISSRLDHGLAEIARAGDLLTPDAAPDASAETIARLTGALAVAIFAGSTPYRRVQFVASHGAPLATRLSDGHPVALPDRTEPPTAFFVLPAAHEPSFQILLHTLSGSAGVLVIAHPAGKTPDSESLRIAEVIARGAIAAASQNRELAALTGLWPKALEDKARTLNRLNSGILERSRFVDQALRSVEDGLIIAGPEGSIAFANRRAAEILDSTETALMGRNLFDRLAECEQTPTPALRETLARLLLDRTPVEREITIRATRTCQYVLRLSAVDGGSGPVRGIVASISNITRQKELQQTKNDVISLVSHEMRTPLAAIQGMSELLAAYEMEPAKRKEMNLAINDEVKRLTRMITEYLNITRLESGAATPRYSPVRLEALLDRTLLLLGPVAAQRRIRLHREVAADVPAVFADPDLLTRAVENLVSNAIKYSAPGREVTVSVRACDTWVSIAVADQGYGIPPAALERIFEKFYRVPRLEDADTPGTGLGLALVRQIAELHGGSIAVKSEVNCGSTFTLTLPIEGR
ncbi:MAG: ATP-binding protein, partial [Acidobacteria bacterium]|nr:ATP-binding protein [Acidobacteriota bacterium]